MNDEILKLAKEVWGYDFKSNTPQFARVEAFYRAAYNKAIEDAAIEAWNLAANVGNHRDADYVRDGVTVLEVK